MIIVKYIVVPARQPSPAPLDVSTVLKSAQVALWQSDVVLSAIEDAECVPVSFTHYFDVLQLEWKPLSDTDVLPEYGDDGVVVALVHSESNKDIAQDGIADDDDAENGNDNDEYSAAQIDPMTSVLNAMGAHGSHAGVQQQGCRALWMMCKSGGIEMKQKMLDAGAHEYAVRAMRMYKGDIHITHYCIGFCQSLAAYAPARPALISMNVHTLVNRAMRAFFESPSLQMQSLVCLRNLALEPSARIMFMPILETICSVMNKHKADPGVQECGCACMSVLSLEPVFRNALLRLRLTEQPTFSFNIHLCQLTTSEKLKGFAYVTAASLRCFRVIAIDPEFKHAMMQGKENNVKAILAAMNSNSGEPEVQIQGLSALISFASKFKPGPAKLVEEGGHKTCVRILANNLSNPGLVIKSSQMLTMLLSTDEGRNSLSNEKVQDHLLSAIKLHLSNSEVVHSCLKTIQKLAGRNSKTRGAMVDANYMETIRDILAMSLATYRDVCEKDPKLEGQSNHKHAETSAGTLDDMTLHSEVDAETESSQLDDDDDDGNLSDLYYDIMNVMEESCILLEMLCDNGAIAAGVVPLLKDCLVAYPDDARLKSVACAALSRLEQNRNAKESFKQVHDLEKVVLNVMNRHSHDPSVQQYALAVLLMVRN